MSLLSILWVLFCISIPILVIYAIVRRVVPSSHGAGITLDDVKRGSVMFAIAVLSAVFANVMAYSVFPSYQDVGGLVVALVLTLAILGAGYAARTTPVVGNGLLGGGLMSLIFCVGVRFDTFEPISRMLTMGTGLVVATFLAYMAGIQPDPERPGHSALKGFRSFVAGAVIFILAILFATYTNEALNPKPAYTSYPYSRSYSTGYYGANSSDLTTSYNESAYQQQVRDYQAKNEDNKRTTVAIVFVLGLLYLVAGLSIRSLVPISAAYVLAGILSILFVLIGSIDSLGASAIAALSGVGTIALIALAYWKLGGPGHDQKPPTLPGPTLSE